MRKHPHEVSAGQPEDAFVDVPSDAKHSPCSVYAVAFLAGTPYLIECAWHEVMHLRTFLREGSCHVPIHAQTSLRCCVSCVVLSGPGSLVHSLGNAAIAAPPTMSSRINELLKLIMLLCLGMYQTGSSSYIHTYIQAYMYHLLYIHTYMQIV